MMAVMNAGMPADAGAAWHRSGCKGRKQSRGAAQSKSAIRCKRKAQTMRVWLV
jgi:hypothetical protein